MASPVHLRHLKRIDDMWFWKAAKCDRMVERMLVGKSGSSQRMLCKTNVLESLQALRNQAVHDHIHPPAAADLGLKDEPRTKRAKINMHEVPEVLTIKAPAYGAISGMSMKVLRGRGSDPLWLHMSELVIDYLVSVMRFQIETSDIHNTKPRHQDVMENHITWESRREAYRARRPDGTTKYFKTKSYSDPKNSAINWVMGDDEEVADDDKPLSPCVSE